MRDIQPRKEEDMYVVAGVTGHTGKVAAETLVAQNKPLTVLVRSAEKGKEWNARGAKIAVASLGDSAALQAVLTGAEGAFLLIPPIYGVDEMLREQAKVVDAVAKAVAASGVAHVVLLSSVAAQHAEGTGPIKTLHYAELALKKVAKTLTVLRPSFFLENWAPSLSAAQKDGVLHTFLTPDQKRPMIATLDIGKIAAECLVHPATGLLVLELAGPEDYSPNDIAAVLTQIFGRPVRAEALPLETSVPVLTGAGFSKDVALLFEEMNRGINSGHVDFERSGTEFRRGTTTAREALQQIAGRTNSPGE
jgi:NAD(P)H dehydrogenase (quinone)